MRQAISCRTDGKVSRGAGPEYCSCTSGWTVFRLEPDRQGQPFSTLVLMPKTAVTARSPMRTPIFAIMTAALDEVRNLAKPASASILQSSRRISGERFMICSFVIWFSNRRGDCLYSNECEEEFAHFAGLSVDCACFKVRSTAISNDRRNRVCTKPQSDVPELRCHAA